MDKITALYSRVSTDIQRDKGLSVPNQKKWLEDEAKKHGFVRLEHFVDNGYSASSTNRPNYIKLMEEIEDGTVGAVVVYKYDRISRNTRDLLSLVDYLKSKEIEFISINEQFDTTTPTGKLYLTMIAGLAEWERSMTVERVKDTMWEMARQGKFCGGQPTFGYDIVNKKLVQNKAESVIIQAIYDKFEDLRTQGSVCRWLNKKGYLTKRGKTWARSTVHRHLTNPIYKGYFTWGKRVNKAKAFLPQNKWLITKGDFEPIISEEQFNRVQAIVRQKDYKKTARRDEPYLLTGIIRCKKCEGSMSGYTHTKKSGLKYTYYRCHNSSSKGHIICPGNSHRMDLIDTSVLEEIQNRVNMHFDEIETKGAINKKKNEPENRLGEIQKQIKKLKEQQKRAYDSHVDGITPRDLYAKKMTEITNQIDRLELKEQELILEINPKAKKEKEIFFNEVLKLSDQLMKLPIVEKRNIVVQLVRRVIVPKEGEIEIELYEV